MNKLIWEGLPSQFTIHSGEDDGRVNRNTNEWETVEWLGKITKTIKYDEFLPKFQGDILVFDENDYKICEVESTHEYYDYTAHFEQVTKVEQTERGDLYLTIRNHVKNQE